VPSPKRWLLSILALLGCSGPIVAFGQIDPFPRELVQFGYNAALEGHAPFSGYAYYYRNQPDFLRTNLTLRLAVAPTYLDSELGVSGALGPRTDLGIGIAGGGFADSYDDIEQGVFETKESFIGSGAEVSTSVYHLFNPGALIPLNGVLRGTAHYTFYDRGSDTAPTFQLPDDRATFSVRAGFRWGGREPTLFPSLAMEVSIWYEGQFRTGADTYGYTNSLRVQSQSQLFWGTALLAYTLPESKQAFYLNLTAGTSVNADRFSAYRLGALLPLVSEFPLSLPGYYYQEISARGFVLLGGNYLTPLDARHHWNLQFNAATACVDYLPGLAQPGNWLSGVGGGILYQSSSLKMLLGYGYGIDAIRSGRRGANSIGFLMQIDLERARSVMNPEEPQRWRGLKNFLGVFTD
jgi:hypothetical protein